MWWWTCVAILSVVVAASESARDEWWEVKIAQGPVRGRRLDNGDLHVFYNIPYATAPTGDKKFKGPLPPPTWTEPYDAVDKGVICPQFNLKPFMPEHLVKEEDCLIANVYVPDTEEKNLSVLVVVHGGGFQVGHGEWMKATNLMKNKDIIVVTFNYRLGLHGFLCLGTEDIPGNAGMKDQVALLRWVQQNIAAFGGNPNDVTITGGSAGAASVHHLMIAKVAEGLFHKIIAESGSNIAAFSVQNDPLDKAKSYAWSQNFTNIDDFYALEEFYKTLSYEIMTADMSMHNPDINHLFSPCIERDTGEEAFLTELPIDILTRGDYKKVPLLFGYSNMEGLLRIEGFDTMWKDQMNEKFSDFLPSNLEFKDDVEKEKVAKQVKEFYFGDKPVSEENILKFVDFNSDIFFVHSTIWAVKLHAEAGHNDVYLYEYSFVDKDTPVIPHTNVRGATHCAQTTAVFDGKSLINSSEADITEEFRTMKKTIREMWYNFIKTGKPVPEGSSLPAWPPAGVDISPYMSLGQKVELRGILEEERFRFWDGIYQKYYMRPVPPAQPPSKVKTEL